MENQQLKKNIAEIIDDYKLIILVITFFITLIIIIISFLTNIIFGYISLAALLTSYIYMISSGFLSFATDHNFAQLGYKDIVLEKTFVPGALIFVLPGYHIIEYKGKMLLDRNEMNIQIEKKEVQFKPIIDENGKEISRRDSVDATKIRKNYYLDATKIYKLLMLAPNDYEKSLSDNSLGDFASAFQNRITELEKAKDFKDFQYYSTEDIKNGKSPNYVTKEGIWILVDEDENGNFKIPTFCESKNLEEAKKELFVSEFATTLKRTKEYGIYLKNITIGDFKDSNKTDDKRNEVRRQDFENEKNDKLSEGRQRRVEKWLEMAQNDSTIINKLEWATNQVNMEDGGRKEIATGSNVIIDGKN